MKHLILLLFLIVIVTGARLPNRTNGRISARSSDTASSKESSDLETKKTTVTADSESPSTIKVPPTTTVSTVAPARFKTTPTPRHIEINEGLLPKSKVKAAHNKPAKESYFKHNKVVRQNSDDDDEEDDVEDNAGVPQTFISSDSVSVDAEDELDDDDYLDEEIARHLYFYSAPENIQSPSLRVNLPDDAPKTNVKILFIKAPSIVTPPPLTIPALKQDKEKTLVYVLVKKPEELAPIELERPTSTPPTKPDVFFIKYNTEQEAEEVVKKLQKKGGQSVGGGGLDGGQIISNLNGINPGAFNINGGINPALLQFQGLGGGQGFGGQVLQGDDQLLQQYLLLNQRYPGLAGQLGGGLGNVGLNNRYVQALTDSFGEGKQNGEETKLVNSKVKPGARKQ